MHEKEVALVAHGKGSLMAGLHCRGEHFTPCSFYLFIYLVALGLSCGRRAP